MFRRSLLRQLGIGAAAGAFLGAGRPATAIAASPAPAAAAQSPEPKTARRAARGLDLRSVDVVDSHMHGLSRTLLSVAYDKQAVGFTDAFAAPGDYPGRAQVLANMKAGFADLVWGQPRRIGYLNYIARTYGVPATLAGFDSVVAKHIGSDTDFTAYVAAIFDRENIRTVVLQSAEPDPAVPPKTSIPLDRFVWTWPFAQTFFPDWARKNNASTLEDVVALIDRALERAVAAGCRGFKNVSAYYRPYDLSPVTPSAADAALRTLLAAAPIRSGVMDVPLYGTPKLTAAFKTYQDYLFKHVYVRAGELERPIIIHSAVALHPSLRPDYNNPLPLYDVFGDGDIQRAGTRFIVIHGGYPSHHVIASMISQFPNVYTDVSFFSKYPGALEELYRTLMALAPSEKIMHGSDANTVPEEVGYCCSNSRAILARVLGDYKTYYGWTASDAMNAGNNILHANARRLFRI
jgi:hypothetical protein